MNMYQINTMLTSMIYTIKHMLKDIITSILLLIIKTTLNMKLNYLTKRLVTSTGLYYLNNSKINHFTSTSPEYISSKVMSKYSG